MRLRSRILAALGVVILAGLALLVVIGAQVSDFWATHIWAGGFINNTATLAPFPAFSGVEVFSLDDPNFHQVHYYLLGSDAGGRDLFALVAKGALPSLVLVALALAGRMLIGVVAGFGIASGATVFRSAARAAGGWIAGFPYLALAVLVLLAELGFLQYYLGGFTNYSEDTQGVAGFHLANTPELGQLLSDVRLYALRNQFFPVLVPAAALALAALGFEIIGRAFRGRTDLPA